MKTQTEQEDEIEGEIRRYMRCEEREVDKALGLKRLVGQGKETKRKYLELMRKYFESYFQLNHERDTDTFAKYFGSKSTPAKQVILDEVGGELLSVKESEQRDKGIVIDDLGKLERELLDANFVSPIHYYRNSIDRANFAVPTGVKVTKHQHGHRLSIKYDNDVGAYDRDLKGADQFDFFPRKLFGRGILFMRFDTPVGESLTHYGGTWALGLSNTTYEADRYGGLVAVQEIDGLSSEQVSINTINRCLGRIQDYLAAEREKAIKEFENEQLKFDAQSLIGKLNGSYKYDIDMQLKRQRGVKPMERIQIQEAGR